MVVWFIGEWKWVNIVELWQEAKTDVMEVVFFETPIMQEPYYWLCTNITYHT